MPVLCRYDVKLRNWDSANGRWIFIQQYSHSGTYGKRLWTMKQGGTINIFATLPRPVDESYLYRKEGTEEMVYYCSSGSLYKYNKTTSSDLGALTWPIATMACKGHTIEYNTTNNSLIFPFEQNGLYGITEYFLP